MKNIFFIFSFLLLHFNSSAQDLEWIGTTTVLGVASSQSQNPFWFYRNTETAVGASSNFSAMASIKASYKSSETASFGFGASAFYRDDVPNEFQRNELYLQFQNNWLRVTAGAKSPEIKVQGLSSTNKNFLFSGNARSIPGLMLEANNPLKFSNTFSIDWGIGHYQLNDERFVEDTRLHYKRLGLNIAINEKNVVTLQLQHYAQWAGTSPVFGKLKSDFEAFVDVFTARKSSEIGLDGEITNAVGNHLGTYLFNYQFTVNAGEFSVYHEHPFEDGSGTRFANFPDGIWGVYFQPENKRIFSGILYEFVTTKDQSEGSVGYDNYFRNNVYRSGWSYERNIIGMPFILIDPQIRITESNSPILSNRVVAHHFGFTGAINKITWQVKSSFVKNLRSFIQPLPEDLQFWYNYLALDYKTEMYGDFRFIGGLDTVKNGDTVIAAGLGYSYNF